MRPPDERSQSHVRTRTCINPLDRFLGRLTPALGLTGYEALDEAG